VRDHYRLKSIPVRLLGAVRYQGDEYPEALIHELLKKHRVELDPNDTPDLVDDAPSRGYKVYAMMTKDGRVLYETHRQGKIILSIH